MISMHETKYSFPIIIIGGGRHSKILFEALECSKRKVIGCTDNDPKAVVNEIGVNVIGKDDVIYEFDASNVELVNGIAEFNKKKLRYNLTIKMKKAGYVFATVIHPTALISTNAILGQGVQVLSRAVVQTGARIGDASIINTGVIIEHDCQIGKFCHVAPGVVMNGSVKIGDNTHIGSGSIITEDIQIGDNCTIAAGSVVYRNIPNNTKFIQKRS